MTEHDTEDINEYKMLKTLRMFHECPAQIRCIVGPVGSGKTTAGAWEICYYLPHFLYETYNMKRTRWVIVRNTYEELIDTTQKTVFEWFGFGKYLKQRKVLTLNYDNGISVEILFRSCDNPNDVKKFQSLELTGYWVDESIKINQKIKNMLKTRIGRFPKRSPVRFGIETTNPPDVEHPTYTQFAWNIIPGPIIEGAKPLENHVGFWQPPYENVVNLRPHYYEDLRNDYADYPDWADMYIDGKPGIIVEGKHVYNNFVKDIHVSPVPLKWSKGTLYRGWDNSGNCPACVVGQMPTANHFQLLREFHTDRKNIIDFTDEVVVECNRLWPNAKYEEWADPAGANEFASSSKPGEFTSNAKLMMEECGVATMPSEQNLSARINSVDKQLGKINGFLIDPSCTRIINGFMGGYCYREVGNTGTYAENPMKNRFSHPHDALQYILVKLTSAPGSNLVGWQPKRNNRRIRNVA